jgi:hypothetical protein
MRLGAALLALGVLASAATAFAQSATPAQKAADPNPVWEPSVLLRPLTLSLAAPDFVPGARYAPRCDENAETTGNSAGPLGTGLPWMGSLGYQLTPRLSVLAFSRLGCPITAGLGGVAAYTIPLAKRMAFSWSGGTYAQPQVIDRGTALKGILRADVLWQSADGQITRTGIEALGVRGATSSAKLGVTYGFTF